jgi:hypothetical protein
LAIKQFGRGRGRPHKFGRPSRAVTLTLPEDVICALERVDDDLGRAVVRVSQPLVSGTPLPAGAELSNYGQSAVIVVRPIAALNRLPGVMLVPMPDGRALISLDDSMNVHEFELHLRDLLAEDRTLPPETRSTLEEIGRILKAARRTLGVTLQQRRIIVLHSRRNTRVAG